ncbi:hypothetical protein JDV02_010715 [Purpureocillium takamizusanense]|uniref:Zn(2)-C6 fungal-type domain-containing protein n=1 Tax=Purpureocillium takamizusanense TaxID=2060973 RepID=A0A9Q8QSJ3_9HYPO|nr:uncharacterized protein JDV02_010715 [Purpureocillium takamizusanense]UNI25005.1 hypothetical protein JDV02_010715 [Purpureocillium takamizusanense]
MVGIAGKSKACLDCKRRRVKCDFTAPLCLRCAKAGIRCRGYERPTIWVNRTPAQPDTTALAAIARVRPPRGSCASSRWLHSLCQMRLQLSGAAYDITQVRAQALILLQDIYLPQPHVMEDSGDPTPFSWPKAVCGMTGPSDALDHALLALCAIQVRLSGETSISYDETVRLYNHALGKVIHDLGSNNDETLAAIVVLSTCELFVFSTDQSWRAHAQGISELLRHRGVPDVPSASWRSLCVRLCVICAIARRCSLSLAPQRWRELIGPAQSSASFPRLLDIVAEVPAIMEETHQLLSGGLPQGDFRAHDYSEMLLQNFHKLHDWRQCYQNKVESGSFSYPVLSRLVNPADDAYPDKLFPFSLKFRSITDAVTWVFCSTIMLQILEAVSRLDMLDAKRSHLSLSDAAVQGSIVLASIESYADDLARKLCQSLEYCFGIENGTFGPQGTCSTQWALQDYFRHRGLRRECEWCENIKDMKGPASRCGIDLMRLGYG